jgi:hypothetical protein
MPSLLIVEHQPVADVLFGLDHTIIGFGIDLLMLMAETCIHPVETGVLFVKMLHPTQIGYLHTAILCLPVVVSRRADAALPAGVFNSLPRIDLLQYPNNLALR